MTDAEEESNESGVNRLAMADHTSKSNAFHMMKILLLYAALFKVTNLKFFQIFFN